MVIIVEGGSDLFSFGIVSVGSEESFYKFDFVSMMEAAISLNDLREPENVQSYAIFK